MLKADNAYEQNNRCRGVEAARIARRVLRRPECLQAVWPDINVAVAHLSCWRIVHKVAADAPETLLQAVSGRGCAARI